MQSRRMVVWLAAVTSMFWAVGVQAQDFELYGTDEKDVATSYTLGLLYDSSLVRILADGSVGFLFAFDTSTVDMSDGSVDWLYALDTSTVDIADGSVGWLDAHEASAVTIAGGSVDQLVAENSSTVSISGGSVDLLAARNLRSGSQDRINVTGGSVGTLFMSFNMVGNEHFRVTTDLTLYDMADYGVQAVEGTVNNVILSEIYASDATTVAIAGGSVNLLNADDTSTVDINSGTVQILYARGSSTVGISGGSVNSLGCNNTTIMAISGGSVSELRAYNTSSVSISGGEVWKLSAYNFSTITFLGKDFVLGEGLEWGEGYELIGTGILKGKWLDGTDWMTEIAWNDETATILLIPEPATLLLLGFGGLALRRQRCR